MILEIIGFLFLLVVGSFFLLAGVVTSHLSYGFTGRQSVEAIIFFLISIGVFYIAYINSPIHLVMSIPR